MVKITSYKILKYKTKGKRTNVTKSLMKRVEEEDWGERRDTLMQWHDSQGKEQHISQGSQGDCIAAVSQRPYSSTCGHKSRGSVVTFIAD